MKKHDWDYLIFWIKGFKVTEVKFVLILVVLATLMVGAQMAKLVQLPPAPTPTPTPTWREWQGGGD